MDPRIVQLGRSGGCLEHRVDDGKADARFEYSAGRDAVPNPCPTVGGGGSPRLSASADGFDAICGHSDVASRRGGRRCSRWSHGTFRPGFSQASGALVLLLLVPGLATTMIFQTQALLAVDRPTLTSVLSVVRLVVTLSASVALTITIGITGTAAGVVLGFAVQLVAQFRFVTSHFETSIFQYWPHRQMSLCSPPIWRDSWSRESSIRDRATGRSVGWATAGSLAYVACVILIGGLSAQGS